MRRRSSARPSGELIQNRHVRPDFDLDLLVAHCRWCHDQTDAPYERGRLIVIALGAGQFTFEVVRRAERGARFGPGS